MATDKPTPAAISPARQRWRAVATHLVTGLSAVLVLGALIVPNQLSALTPAAFLRLPVEALVGVGLALLLPARARPWVLGSLGAALGLLTIVKVLDMGFFETFARPFDPMLDATYFAPAVDVLTRTIGRVGAIAAAVGAGLLVLAVPVGMALATLRLSRIVVARRAVATRAVAALSVVWLLLAAAGVRVVADTPVAQSSASVLAFDHLRQVGADLADRRDYERAASVDAFRDTPGADLLTGLRGKDVVIAFVESYGRVALEDPQLAPGVRSVLADGERRLTAAGFGARSAWLTSPTAGGASWLAHSTLQSGLWIDNRQRYGTLVASDRLTLASAFHRAGWRTVNAAPADQQDWPEGAFYGYDKFYDARNLGYRGPQFTFSSMPDQYTLAAIQRAERGPGHAPVMAELDLLSSHAPWAPLPKLVDWDTIGDGSVFQGMPEAGQQADEVWRDNARIRAEYGHSVEYSVGALISYVAKYGGDNLVLILLGDHQPAPVVTGQGASKDVPITIVAHDPAVLAQVSGWHWQAGLTPGAPAPIWPMDAFRDRFLTAFGPPAQSPGRGPSG